MPPERDSLSDRLEPLDPCDGCDGTCGDVCPVMEAQRLNRERNQATTLSTAWKARGRELNALYDALTEIVEEPAPGFDPVADLKALGAQRDRLRAENARLKLAAFYDKADRSMILQGLAKLDFGYAREVAARIEATKCKACVGTGYAPYVGGEYEEDACPACEGTGFGVATDEENAS